MFHENGGEIFYRKIKVASLSVDTFEDLRYIKGVVYSRDDVLKEVIGFEL